MKKTLILGAAALAVATTSLSAFEFGVNYRLTQGGWVNIGGASIQHDRLSPEGSNGYFQVHHTDHVRSLIENNFTHNDDAWVLEQQGNAEGTTWIFNKGWFYGGGYINNIIYSVSDALGLDRPSDNRISPDFAEEVTAAVTELQSNAGASEELAEAKATIAELEAEVYANSISIAQWQANAQYWQGQNSAKSDTIETLEGTIDNLEASILELQSKLDAISDILGN